MIGRNAAKLELSLVMKVHPVFNVALLKRYHRLYLLKNPIPIDDDAQHEVK